MTANRREEQIVFESNGLRLFGMIHRPPGGKEPNAGIVMCYPFAEERKSAYRVMVTTARKLSMSDNGFAVLRFDYGGCGDSEGEFRNSTISTRLTDIKSATSLLQERTGVADIGLLGLRFGAALAASFVERESQEEAKIKFLILWEPVIDCKKYFEGDLRKKLIKEMMTDGKGKTNRREILESLNRDETELDFDGYLVSGEMYKELAELNLIEKPRTFSKPVLIIPISFNGKVPKPIETLYLSYKDTGADTTITPVIEEPFWNAIDPVDCPNLMSATIEWLKSISVSEPIR